MNGQEQWSADSLSICLLPKTQISLTVNSTRLVGCFSENKSTWLSINLYIVVHGKRHYWMSRKRKLCRQDGEKKNC